MDGLRLEEESSAWPLVRLNTCKVLILILGLVVTTGAGLLSYFSDAGQGCRDNGVGVVRLAGLGSMSVNCEQ